MPALFSVSGQINFSAGVGVGSALFNRPEKTNVGEKRYYVVIEASRFVDEGEPYEPKENDRVDIPLSSNPNALEAFRVVEAAPLRFGVRAIAWRLLVTR